MGVVAIFSGYYLPFLGGIERYTNKLALELIRKGHKVVVVTSNHAELASYEEMEGVAIYRLPTYRLFRGRYPLIKKNQDYRDLIKQLDTEGVEYVICNTRFQLTTPLGIRFAKRRGLKPIIIEHGSSHFSVGVPVLDFMGKFYEHALTALIKRSAKEYYGVSKRCNQWLTHYKIVAKGVFYNSVDANTYQLFKRRQYKRDLKDALVITYAGRIIREKGVEVLLRAFTNLAKKHKNIVLVIAGDGPLLKELEVDYNHPRIFFEGKLGYRDTMPLLGRTDIFCHPSMYPEGLPTSILEAGIMKCAVIATDRGGTKEVIVSPEYGIIIEEDEESLTEELDAMITNPSQVSLLKENLHDRVKEHFTWEVTAQKVEEVLMEKNDHE